MILGCWDKYQWDLMHNPVCYTKTCGGGTDASLAGNVVTPMAFAIFVGNKSKTDFKNLQLTTDNWTSQKDYK